MKDRFWNFYYWAMIGYLLLAFIVLAISHLTWNDRQTTLSSPFCNEFDMSNDVRCLQGDNVPSFFSNINNAIFFKFVGYKQRECSERVLDKNENGRYFYKCIDKNIDLDRYIEIQNYYPFLLVLFMTLVRWISIGKHIWQRP